jgi:hypothetical protein
MAEEARRWNTQAWKYYTIVARDAKGRMYREDRGLVPADSTATPPLQAFILYDPTKGTRTFCTPASHTCRVTAYRFILTPKILPVGAAYGGKEFIVREPLGDQTRESLNVSGTRETLTIAEGTQGNAQPIVVTKEFWYSPELQINMEVIRKDPRYGTQTFTVTNLNRSEPDSKFFEIPSGYKMINDKR